MRFASRSDACRRTPRRARTCSSRLAPDPAEIKALVEAVRPKPINLLVVRDSGLSVADIAALGVRRISVGGALALAAWTGFRQAAQVLKSEGSFAGLAKLVPYPEINGFFTTDYHARHADGLRSSGSA